MEPIKHPARDPGHENKPVQASTANYSQNNPGSTYIVKKNTLNWNSLLVESRFFGECGCAKGKTVHLEEDSKKRIIEVTETKEPLVNYPKKAAEDAKKRQEELSKQPVIVIEKTERN